MKYIFEFLQYVSVTLQFLLLVLLLLRSNFRRYSFLLVYVLTFLVTGVLELRSQRIYTVDSLSYRHLFMADEVILDLLLFLMVITMTYRAMGESPLRAKIGRVLAVVVTVVILVPFVVFRGPLWSTRWFYATSQLLNFGGAVMNLGLWTALAGNKQRDSRVLAVSAGLGIAVTGAAISYGLMAFSWGRTGITGQLVAVSKSTFNVLSLMIWCWTFWPVWKPPQQSPRALTSL
jgi:hypothetical protein